MLDKNHERVLTNQAGGGNIIAFAQAQHLGVDHTYITGHGRNRDDQTDAQDAAAADSGQDHRQNQRRDGEQSIGDTHDNVAHDALEITGDQAQSRANQRCPEGGQR